MLGHDPLIDALFYKNPKIAKFLLDKNIKINRCYFSAVYWTINNSYDDILEELIKKGADICCDRTDIKFSYIFEALILNDYKYVLKLLQSGAKYDYQFDTFEKSLLYYVITDCKNFHNDYTQWYNSYHNYDKNRNLKLKQITEKNQVIQFLINNDHRYDNYRNEYQNFINN